MYISLFSMAAWNSHEIHSSSVGVKFEPEFLMSISCVLNLSPMATWNSINFDHPSVGILGIPKFMLISCVLN